MSRWQFRSRHRLSVPRNGCYDVAVIGAGVVGCATARALTLAGASVVALEKEADILEGSSKGNSAILHTGYDSVEGSLEQKFVARGRQIYLDTHESLGLPLLKTGAMVATWTEEQERQLPGVVAHARGNGVDDVRILSRGEVLRREPCLSSEIRAAALVPGEGIIDPWSTPLAYLAHAVDNGADACFGCELAGGEFDGMNWQLRTGAGAIRARYVVNCAGLHGDLVDRLLTGSSNFIIRPRKGQFVVFDKVASKLLGSIVMPLSTPSNKGIVLCRTIFGNVMVGPTSEEQKDRSDTSVDRETLRLLLRKAAQILPGLRDMSVTAVFAGLRPAIDYNDYRIDCREEMNLLTIGGIRSTGLSAALGLAEHARETVCARLDSLTAIAEPVATSVPNIAEHLERSWEKPGQGEIVCHCELVTSGEIEAAFEGPLPPGDLNGIKRRTRATMGRCQGFYCSARVDELACRLLDRDSPPETRQESA